MLGAAYYSGESVLQDKAEALRWFLKSAELGYTGAQYDLGSRYETGTGGVSKDEAEAVHWYRKAAEQGFAPAQLSLGMQYLYGEGVAKDDAEAYFWISLAALISTSNDEYITSKRDKAGTTLTPEKRLEIQERCREWVKAHPTVHGWAGIASAKRNPRLTTPR
jgi:hypothetical protein